MFRRGKIRNWDEFIHNVRLSLSCALLTASWNPDIFASIPRLRPQTAPQVGSHRHLRHLNNDSEEISKPDFIELSILNFTDSAPTNTRKPTMGHCRKSADHPQRRTSTASSKYLWPAVGCLMRISLTSTIFSGVKLISAAFMFSTLRPLYLWVIQCHEMIICGVHWDVIRTKHRE